MARRPGTGNRWLGALALPAALCAAPPPSPAPALANAAVPAQKDKLLQMDKPSSPKAPDPALLEYLGRYGDAAIGLDPLGLDSDDAGAGGPDKERR
jgi:hypothetical protein